MTKLCFARLFACFMHRQKVVIISPIRIEHRSCFCLAQCCYYMPLSQDMHMSCWDWKKNACLRSALLCAKLNLNTTLWYEYTIHLTRSRATLKFWSATMFGAAARNFGPVHKFELPTVIADSVPRATRVFSLASVGHVTGHQVEDDTEILIRYNVWGRGPKFWTGT